MSVYNLVTNALAVMTVPGPIIRPVQPDQAQNITLLGQGPLTPGLNLSPPGPQQFQLNLTGSGTISATVRILASNDATGKNWVPIRQLNVSGTNACSGGVSSTDPWTYFAGQVMEISGINTSASVVMSC